MNLHRLLRSCDLLSPTQRRAISDRLRADWRGIRIWMTVSACKRAWRCEHRGPRGAAERAAADIDAAIPAEGGTEHDVRAVLISCMSGYVEI